MLNNADAFTSEPGTYNNDNSPDIYADCDPELAGVVGRNDQGIVEKCFVQVREI
jgi:hypothetical protein